MISNRKKKFEKFTWNQNTIELRSAAKYLGFPLHQKVTFNQHIVSVRKKCNDSYPFFIKQDSFSAHLFSLEFTSSLYIQCIKMEY